MADFARDIPLKYQELDYNGVINNYNWIKENVDVLLKNNKIIFYIMFKIGEITCTCRSVNEFLNHAYGQNIYVITYYLNFYEIDNMGNTGQSISAFFNMSTRKVSLECENKETLINIYKILEKSLVMQEGENNSPVYNITQGNGCQMVIGDNNITQNNNTVNNGIENNQFRNSNSIFNHILQSIAEKWVWIILLILLYYLGVIDKEWLNIIK